MKRNTLFLLPVCFLLFTSCNNTGPQRQPLGKPVITVNAQKNGITWDAVEDAVSYKVTVNSEAPQTVTTPGYAFSTAEGNYTVSVVAVADDEKYNSEASSYAYSTSKTSVGELSIEGAVITWASYTGMGLEVKFGDNGIYADVTGTSYTATETGTYIFHAKPGFNETTKVFYVDGENSTKSIDADLRGTLQSPVLALNTEKNGIVWADVTEAVGYKVQIDENEPEVINTTSYAFDTTVGQHTIKVIALANPITHHDSEPASFAYEVKATALGEVTNTEGHLTWASSVGAGIEYNINGGEFIAVQGNEVVVTKSGAYTIKASEGYDETNNILYLDVAGTVNKRAIVVTAAAADAFVVEDGSEASSADVKDKYYIERYNNGWAENTDANLTLCNYNKGYTEGNSVCVKYFKHGMAFRFNQYVTIPGGYDTINATIKGENNANASFTVTLRIRKTVKIGDLDLTGVYAYYKLANTPQRWTALSVSMNDAAWKIGFGGQEVGFSDVKTALTQSGVKGVEKLSDLLPLFDTVCFSFNCPADANWSPTYAYIDDFKFTNSAASTGGKTLQLKLEDHYAFESNSLQGRLDKNGNNWVLSFPYNGTAAQLPVTSVTNGDDTTFTCSVTGYDFEAVMTSTDDGKTMSLKSVTGSASALLAGLKAEAYYVVDNFESYADTTALRSAFYADYYSGSGSSIIGGNGWSKMTSSDYMDLASKAENVRNGSHSARMKYNNGNQMRYSSIALTDGSGLPYRKASALSFWTKGMPTIDNKIKVKVYYSAQVTPSTQDSNVAVAEVTVKKGSGWTEVVVPLNANLSYYGFSIIPVKGSGAVSGDNQYFFVDDICLYGSISPWLQLKKNYAFETSTGIKGKLAYSAGAGVLSFTYNEQPTELPVSMEVLANGKVSMKSTVTNYDFEATLTTNDKYTTLNLESATGTIAALLTGFKAAAYVVVDNFESYSATGVGYDQKNTADKRSGLRGAFYSDYYSGGSGSPLGGSGWSLMGSTDYIELNKEAANAHGGSQSARFKYNAGNQMRYFSYSLYDGTAKAYDKATTFSMWIKGTVGRDNVVKVRVYYVQKVSNAAGTVNSYTEKSITVPAGTDWVEAKVTLDASKTYYGYSFLPIKGNGAQSADTQYFFVDDVAIYNSISPYAA